ncbi:MAG: LysM peptidoglycan-binding domain-containing protein [Flavobacteriales bacterium]|jgi:membrane-bound lytic murein transglycosylase D|nr:LysM peptidoglycan-binding domain-containing protein [Flavobacteriales bacterium]
MRAFAIISVLTTACAPAQPLWRLDSLVATWPVRSAQEADRRQHAPGVVRAMDTRGLFAKLRTAQPGLPVFADSLVARYVDVLGEARRDDLRAALGLVHAYDALIEGELVQQGLPKELKRLPLALSCMNTLAEGPEGGAGLWMLTYPVALRYGLRVNGEVDERLDPRLSTMAAVRYLKDLFAQHGDWSRTIMAFTCGPANLQRAIGRTHATAELHELYPHVTAGVRDALPFWMAMCYLASHQEQLGIAPMTVTPMEPADTLRSPQAVRFDALAMTLGLPLHRLRALNPTLCGAEAPAYHALLVPKGEGVRYSALSDSIAHVQQALVERARTASEPGADAIAQGPSGREAIYYRVRSGDFLGRIAQRFNVKVSQIRTWNRMRGDHIDVGEELVIWVTPAQRARFEKQQERSDDADGPVNDASPKPDGATAEVPVDAEHPPSRSAGERFTWYTVRKGDSLYGIAKRYPGVDADSLMRVNGIGPGIRPGQRIKVPTKP